MRTSLELPRWPTVPKPFPAGLDAKLPLGEVVPDDGDGPLDAERRTLIRLTHRWQKVLDDCFSEAELTYEGKKRRVQAELPKFTGALDELTRRLEGKRVELADRRERMAQPKRSLRSEVSATAELIEELRRQEIRSQLVNMDAIRREDALRVAVTNADLETCNAVASAPTVFGELATGPTLEAVRATLYPEHAAAVRDLEVRIPLFDVALRDVRSWLEASANASPEDMRAIMQRAEFNERVAARQGASVGV